MGKKKIQIKKIENTTNRQVTYSKRRNGLIKKAYEIYVLCGVDVALILFSPSGKVNLFSGNKRIEDVLWRYVSLPVYERGRLHDEELLHRTLDNMRAEVDPTTLAPSPKSIDVQAKEIQHEIDISQHQLDEMEKRLRIFEGDPTRITSLREVEYNEHIIEETLNHVRACMLVLEEKNVSPGIQPNKQPQNVNANGFVTGNPIPNHPLNWVPSTDPQPQAHNILDSNGLLPSRDQTQPLGAFLPQPSTFHHENYMHLGNHMNTSSGVLNKRDVGFIDGNPPQWNEFNTIGIRFASTIASSHFCFSCRSLSKKN